MAWGSQAQAAVFAAAAAPGDGFTIHSFVPDSIDCLIIFVSKASAVSKRVGSEAEWMAPSPPVPGLVQSVNEDLKK